MSRKSRIALLRERLGQISDCPTDILNVLLPEEEDFSYIEAASRNDLNAVKVLTRKLYTLSKILDEANAAALYYAKAGLELGDRECAEIMLRYIIRFNDHFEHLPLVSSVLSNDGDNVSFSELIEEARVQQILASYHVSNYKNAASELGMIGSKRSEYAQILLASKHFKSVGEYDGDSLLQLSNRIGIPTVITLPTFWGGAPSTLQDLVDNAENEAQAIIEALTLLATDEWCDFWLRILYEYTLEHLGRDLTSILKCVSDTVEARCDYPRKKLHLLALKKYLQLRGDEAVSNEVTALRRECLFDGLNSDVDEIDTCERLIREAVYTSGEAEKQNRIISARLGNIIGHVKNRYTLCATMTNHIKRGAKHLWETLISIETESNTPPRISVTRITDRNNEITRNGIRLEKQSKPVQILSHGEIFVTDKPSPIEIDLILDISYVSSTKCEHCEIVTKGYERFGKYLVMRCQIAVY